MTKLTKLAAMLIISSPMLTKAQGFQVNLQGQVQQGMGGAGTALMQDGAALFFNPGGASFLSGNTVNLGVSPTIPHGVFVDKNTFEKTETTSKMGTPFAAYGAFELKDSSKLKLGLAIYTPFGSTVDWPAEWEGRFALTHLELKAIFFQPTVSYKINDKWGIGAGFVYAKGNVNLQKDLPIVDNTGAYGKAELSGKASGIGGNFGLYYKPCTKFAVGLTLRTQVDMQVKSGDAKFTVPASLADKFPSGKFKAELPLPQVITVGFAYMPTDKLSFALDINHVGWEAYSALAFDYENNSASLTDTYSKRNYKNIFAFRFGTQYKVTEALAVRLGGAYGMSPVQKGYVTPETPDNNRFNYTAGLGYNINKKFGVDASFTFTTFKREDKNIETGLDGTYKTAVAIPGLSLHYNF